MNPVYMTGEQVRKYVATWLKFVASQPMSQPRHFMRIKTTLRLPSPKGDNK